MLLLEGWAREGLNDEQIAHNMGVHPATYYRWQADHNELREAIKKGKAPVDFEIENSLRDAAKGQRIILKKPIKLKTTKRLAGKGTIEEEHVEYVEEEIYIPPNVTAQIYWLNNRKPDKWRNRKAVDVEATNAEPVKVVIDV